MGPLESRRGRQEHSSCAALSPLQAPGERAAIQAPAEAPGVGSLAPVCTTALETTSPKGLWKSRQGATETALESHGALSTTPT